MALAASSYYLPSLYLFFLLSLSSSSSAARPPPSTAAIDQACRATRFPDICTKTLKLAVQLPPNPNPTQIISAAISASAANLVKAQAMVKTTFDSSSGNVNRTNAARTCLEILDNSMFRTQSTLQALTRGGGEDEGVRKDGRAWMCAAVHFQYACWSALSYVNDTRQVVNTMAFLNDTLLSTTSNALSMVASFDTYGKDLARWGPPKTERDGFWAKTGSSIGSGFNPGGVPSGLTAKATVSKDGSEGSFKTVQEAVDVAAPSNSSEKFVIRIKAGIYEETIRVPLHKKNLVFLGEGIGKTVISGSLAVGPGISTYNTAIVGVLGDGFMMSGVTVENTAGPDAHQAVAFRSDSDRSVIENCEFLGNQDTLYVDTLRQYYKSCHIEGNVDFIFGNSAAVFQNCTIHVRPRQVNPEKGESNAVSAQGRVDPAQSTGLVFNACIINGTKEYMDLYNKNSKVHRNYLGRPWKEYSRTVYINCIMGPLISPDGWLPWKEDFALKTLYYGESANTGPGANIAARVPWSSKIPAKRVGAFSVQSFIQGDLWIPTSSS